MIPHALTTTLAGFCPWSIPQMLDALNRCIPPSHWPGDFVFVVESTNAAGDAVTTLLSSAVAATPYYFTTKGETMHHGASVFDVIASAGVPWRWNRRAVNCMALFEHCLQDDTLHPDVRRVPPSSRITFENGELRIETDTAVWDAFAAPEDGTSDKLVEATIDLFGEITRGRKVAVSLSAGYDSRALLALALHAGMRPVTGTMGNGKATDMKVAAKIATSLGLEHRCVEIRAEDYLRQAARIVRVTSGTKSAAHWHTHLFATQAGYPHNHLHLVGSNGELARTYFLDKGIAALGADGIGRVLRKPFFQTKFGVRRKLPGLALRSFLQPSENDDIAAAIADADESIHRGSGLLRPLDEFYTMQRVRHFIGAGLAALSSVMQIAAPFLDARFVMAAACLRRREKMNGRFHRRLIARCRKELLDFPTDDTSIPMAAHERTCYWLRRSPSTPYNPLREWLQSPAVEELVMESRHLDQFIPRADRTEILRRRQSQFLCFLVTMHAVCEEVARLPTGREIVQQAG
jgi:hypothetical protein